MSVDKPPFSMRTPASARETSAQIGSGEAPVAADRAAGPAGAELGSAQSAALHSLPEKSLYRVADLSQLSFTTTTDLEPAEGLVGQERAVDAISLATGMDAAGFNLFVAGPNSAGIRQTVQSVLSHAATKAPPPSDWVYVHNFTDPHRPIAIDLPRGMATVFRDAMHNLIADLKLALPAAFEHEDYQKRHAAIDDAARQKQADLLDALGEKARRQDIAIVRTPVGFGFVPTKDGNIVEPKDFNSWPEDQKERVRKLIQALEQELEHVLMQTPAIEKERRDAIRALNRETAMRAVGHLMDEVKAHFRDLPKIAAQLDRVRENLIERVPLLLIKNEHIEAPPEDGATLFELYEVNAIVCGDANEQHVPIVEESHPTLINLIGRTEYLARQGVLSTNFRLIKPGALHRANGGYLVLDARHLLSEPYSWQALKRALRSGEIAIEDIGRFMGLTGTISLEPGPIPLKVRVVLIGERLLYHALSEWDPEFREHFKLLADFDDNIARSAQSESMFARSIADTLKRQGLKPMDRAGVALVIEHAARLADDADKLAVVADDVRDILVEADHWGTSAGHNVLSRSDVQRALDERDRRAARIRERAQEAILRDIALIETAGRQVGQMNGLSVADFGGTRFGWPTRITARVRPGAGTVTDIEREVALGGPLHSKGVLILSGFLSGRYALDTPMSLSASLVFEQSYGGVEGDSASLAELCALLSALSELPLRQDLAVTGSINQHGEVQAIGGVNEKIEGFFDICNARGLTSTQGVIIPKSNTKHLMLRADVVAACRAGTFAVYTAGNVDEAMELLTGHAAGRRESDGRFADNSVNRLVEDRLRAFASIRRSFGEPYSGMQKKNTGSAAPAL